MKFAILTITTLVMIGCGEQNPTHRSSDPLQHYGALSNDVPMNHAGKSEGPLNVCQDAYSFSLSNGTSSLNGVAPFIAGKPNTFTIVVDSQYGDMDLKLFGDNLPAGIATPQQVDRKTWTIQWTPPQVVPFERKEIHAVLTPKTTDANAPICFQGQFRETFEIVVKDGWAEPVIKITGLDGDRAFDSNGLINFEVDAEDPTFDSGGIPDLAIEYPYASNPTGERKYFDVRPFVHCVSSGEHGKFHYKCSLDLDACAKQNPNLNGMAASLLVISYTAPHSHLTSKRVQKEFFVHYPEKVDPKKLDPKSPNGNGGPHRPILAGKGGGNVADSRGATDAPKGVGRLSPGPQSQNATPANDPKARPVQPPSAQKVAGQPGAQAPGATTAPKIASGTHLPTKNGGKEVASSQTGPTVPPAAAQKPADKSAPLAAAGLKSQPLSAQKPATKPAAGTDTRTAPKNETAPKSLQAGVITKQGLKKLKAAEADQKDPKAKDHKRKQTADSAEQRRTSANSKVIGVLNA